MDEFRLNRCESLILLWLPTSDIYVTVVINSIFILMDIVYQESIQLTLKMQTPFMFTLKHLENINKLAKK